MRQTSAVLFFLLLSISSQSAGNDLHWVQPYETIFGLTHSDRKIYVAELRYMLNELEEYQATQGKYGLNFYLRPKYLEIFNFLPCAQAVESGGDCVFAGNFSKWRQQGSRLLCSPPSGSCATPVECNSTVFGGGVTTSCDNLATRNCDARGKSPEEVAADLGRGTDSENKKRKWNEAATALNNFCSSSNSAPQSFECRIIQKRLENIKKKLGDNVPQPQRRPPPTPVPPTPKPQPQPVKIDAGQECKTNRDQGVRGSCNAFCLTCQLDTNARKAVAGKGIARSDFRTSANWIAMLSMAGRLCATKENKGQELEGWDPHMNLQAASSFGFCDEQTYLPYSPKEPGEHDQSKPVGSSEIRRFLEQRGTLTNLDLLNSRDEFFNQFGISKEGITALFCPANNGTFVSPSEYKNNLRKLAQKHSNLPKFQNFVACAEEGLKIKDAIDAQPPQRACNITVKKEVGKGATPEQFREFLIEELRAGRPVAISARFPDLLPYDPKNQEQLHCMTVTAVDLEKKEFTIVNSWGGSTNQPSKDGPLNFSEIGPNPKGQLNHRIIYAGQNLSCPGVQNNTNPTPASTTTR